MPRVPATWCGATGHVLPALHLAAHVTAPSPDRCEGCATLTEPYPRDRRPHEPACPWGDIDDPLEWWAWWMIPVAWLLILLGFRSEVDEGRVRIAHPWRPGWRWPK